MVRLSPLLAVAAVAVAGFAGCANPPPEMLRAHPGALLTLSLSDGSSVQSVRFSAPGFESVLKPVARQDGAVVVAVPVYIDDATNRPAPGTVDVSVSTDGAAFRPVTRLQITDLPSVESLPLGAATAVGYRILAQSAYHRATELSFWQAALVAGNGSELFDDIMAQLGAAALATEMARNVTERPGDFDPAALAASDQAFGLWLAALASAAETRTMKTESDGTRVSLLPTVDLELLEYFRTAWSDVRTMQEIVRPGGGVLERLVGVTSVLTDFASKLGAEPPAEAGALIGLTTGQTAATAATGQFMQGFSDEVRQGITSTAIGADDFEPTPTEQYGRLLFDGIAQTSLQNLDVVRGSATSAAYQAFTDGLAVVERVLEHVASDETRDEVQSLLGDGPQQIGGGWVTGNVEGPRTESGLDFVRVDLCGGPTLLGLSAITGAGGRYAIPAPAKLGGGSCEILAFDPVTEDVVADPMFVDLSGLEDGKDVRVPALPEAPPRPKEYEGGLAGVLGSVSGYGDCTWAISFYGTVTILLPPDPQEPGAVGLDVTAVWDSVDCEDWSGSTSVSGQTSMRTTSLFSATLDGTIEEHPLRFKLDGNMAGSTPWAVADLAVTWEPEVSPRETHAKTNLQFY